MSNFGRNLIYVGAILLLINCSEISGNKHQTARPKTSNQIPDSTRKEIEKILSFEHNFNLALIKKVRDKGAIKALSHCNTAVILKDIKTSFDTIFRVKDVDSSIAKHFSSQNLYTPLSFKDTLHYPVVAREDFCLKCHGTPYLMIPTEIYNQIRKQYPEMNFSNKKGDIVGYWKYK